MTNLIKKIITNNDGIFPASNTDEYHVPTGQVMWRQGADQFPVTSNAVLRGTANSGYTIIGGIGEIAESLPDFRFDAETLEALEAKGKYDKAFLTALKGKPFNVRIDAVRDGEVIFANGPLMRLTGDPIEVKWLDTVINALLRECSTAATKGARLTSACALNIHYDYDPASWSDQGMRRWLSLLGLSTAKYAFITGGKGTSNMRAGIEYGIPTGGTMDHFYVKDMMAHWFLLHPEADPFEKAHQHEAHSYALECYMKEFPEGGVLLLDTINISFGLEDAIRLFQKYRPKSYGVRIDSSRNMARTAKWVHEELAQHGFGHFAIALSGGLGARAIAELRRAQVPFNAVGIGEYFQYGRELHGQQPEDPVNVEIVTKVGAIQNAHGNWALRAIKLSELREKSGRGGILDRVRMLKETEKGLFFDGDVEVDLLRGDPGEHELAMSLNSIDTDTEKAKRFEKGTLIQRPIRPLLDGPRLLDETALDMHVAKAFHTAQFAMLPDDMKGFDTSNPISARYGVGVEMEHLTFARKMYALDAAIARV